MWNRDLSAYDPDGPLPDVDPDVDSEACDGFILIPHVIPGGLDRFAEQVVPLLQERGAFRSDYAGGTLREHLGLKPVAPPVAVS